MPERKSLVTITAVTDHDTGMYHIGEVDGIFQDHELQRHIEAHGSEGLLSHLAYLTYQVIDMRKKISGLQAEQQAAGTPHTEE